MKKLPIYKFVLISFFMFTFLSCEKEKDSFRCTIYLNGDVWSEKVVSNCDNCFAPRGYTTTCKKQ